MTVKIRKDIRLPLLTGSLIFAISLLLGIGLSTELDNPEFCNSCHEMQTYYSSYLNPRNGSIIAGHELNCIQCHANRSIYDAKKKIATEIIVHTLNLSGPFIPALDLKANCQECHSLSPTSMHKSINLTNCTYCHWAHKPADGLKTDNKSILPLIPYGPHRNQSCSKCHGTNFEIPRCIKCHSGHGEQKLENSLCLTCHINPHVPKKPGILPNNTVEFKVNLPFSVCQPCHEKEYFELTNSASKHTYNETCVMCHSAHGRKPACTQCHKAMQVKGHLTLECKNCHRPGGKAICQECHGKSHEWSALTVIVK